MLFLLSQAILIIVLLSMNFNVRQQASLSLTFRGNTDHSPVLDKTLWREGEEARVTLSRGGDTHC